jgi:phage host-nuclease inhibitor protein Gam
MDGTIEQVRAELNELANKRFAVQVRLDAVNRRHSATKALMDESHAKLVAEIEAEGRAIDDQIVPLIQARRDELILPEKQSFLITLARFQFRKVDPRTEVVDAKAIMAIARSKGFVRKIAKASVKWNFNQEKFFAWLAKNQKLRTLVDQFLKDHPGGETLHMSPNTGYTVAYSGTRISPPSIKIHLDTQS